MLHWKTGPVKAYIAPSTHELNPNFHVHMQFLQSHQYDIDAKRNNSYTLHFLFAKTLHSKSNNQALRMTYLHTKTKASMSSQEVSEAIKNSQDLSPIQNSVQQLTKTHRSNSLKINYKHVNACLQCFNREPD